MAESLRHCPFCGQRSAQPIMLGVGRYHVHCYSCHAQGPEIESVVNDYDAATEQATKAWNERWTLVKTTVDSDLPSGHSD